jgi:hypothetical protein
MTVSTRSQTKHKRSESIETETKKEEPVKKKQKTKTKKTAKDTTSNEVLEYGHIYFFYRPKIDVQQAEDWNDVSKFYLLLKTVGSDSRCRLISIAKKRLPNINSHEREWGYVAKTAKDPKEIVDSVLAQVTKETETQGEKESASARPVGEGLYAIVKHDKSSRLAYVLEVPNSISPVQKAFRIEKEGDFIVSVKNPKADEEEQYGLPKNEKATFKTDLQDAFRGNKWAPLDPPAFLDHEGAELLFIGGHHDIKRDLQQVGEQIEEKAEKEIEKNHYKPEALYRELRMKVKEHPIEAIKGEWV